MVRLRCGALLPAREKWDGWGFEYKSDMTLFGLPLLHIPFKYRPNFLPLPARGIIAVGQFACGYDTDAVDACLTLFRTKTGQEH
jgi:hypothetical protein